MRPCFTKNCKIGLFLSKFCVKSEYFCFCIRETSYVFGEKFPIFFVGSGDIIKMFFQSIAGFVPTANIGVRGFCRLVYFLFSKSEHLMLHFFQIDNVFLEEEYCVQRNGGNSLWDGSSLDRMSIFQFFELRICTLSLKWICLSCQRSEQSV